jgi:hypothetical protein
VKSRTPEQVKAVLLRSIRIDERSGCWLWTKSIAKSGYGQIGFMGKNAYAHRVAWIVHNGDIQEGLHVLHKCDVKACINPCHLFLGTAAENVRDMIAKGRARMSGPSGDRNPLRLYPGLLSGEKHGMAKLTANAVKQIRNRYAAGETQKSLSREFGVNQPHISRIVRNTNWRTA